MKRLTTRLLAAAGVLALTVGLITPGTAEAAATMPTPILDPFFNVPTCQYKDKKSGEFTTTEKLAVFLVLVLGGRNVEERVKYGGRHGSSGFSCSRGDEADGESKHACCSEESCSQTLHNSLS